MRSKEEIFLMSLLFLSKKIESKDISDPAKYITDNQEKFFSTDVYDYVYQNILAIPNGANVTPKGLISTLVVHYICTQNDEEDFIIRFLNFNPADDVYTFFSENSNFAYGLISNFIKTAEKKIAYEYNHFFGLKVKFDESLSVEYLPDMLRNAFDRFYNGVCLKSGTAIPPARLFLLIINQGTFVKGTPALAEDVETLKKGKDLLLRIIYGDIYEDLVVSGLYDVNRLPITNIIKNAVESGQCEWPIDNANLDRLINHFNYLLSNPTKRLTNRKRLDKSKLDVLKNINPFYMLQEREVNKR